MSSSTVQINWATDPNETGVTDLFRWTIAEAFITLLPAGAVISVNGHVGVVVLTAADVDALPISGGTLTGNLELADNRRVIAGSGGVIEVAVPAGGAYINETGAAAYSNTTSDYAELLPGTIDATRDSAAFGQWTAFFQGLGAGAGRIRFNADGTIEFAHDAGAGFTGDTLLKWLEAGVLGIDGAAIMTEDSAASTTDVGVSRFATPTETQAGTATGLGINPAGLAAALRSPSLFVVGNGVATQSIPNATWTSVNFAAAVDADGYPAGGWAAGTPSRIFMTGLGYVVMLGEIAWACNATGVRRVRWVADAAYAFTACETVMPGLAADVPNGFTKQHMQCYVAGPVTGAGHFNELQVWQNSGGALNLVSDGFAAPQVMVFYPTP